MVAGRKTKVLYIFLITFCKIENLDQGSQLFEHVCHIFMNKRRGLRVLEKGFKSYQTCSMKGLSREDVEAAHTSRK